jgi:glycerol transport system substrate-binding protein
MAASGPAWADMAAAERWIDEEFQPSVLSREEQLAEMEWFIQAAEPFSGMEINVVAEAIPTHQYEAEVLTRAFEEITGIKVNMQTMGEGDVVQAVQTQLQTGRNIYDMFVNDADLIGMHSRLGLTVNLTEWMAGDGRGRHQPGARPRGLLRRALHHRAGRQPLPAARPAVRQPLLVPQGLVRQRRIYQAAFREKYGYDLGVPVNWSAYEDIAEFFTNDVGEIDGVKIYGHMDYGKRAPDLGWRMTDAWLSMAGAADLGVPNGVPVDEWGIRMEAGSCNPVGASVTRGGAPTAGAVYAIEKWDEWMRTFAPPGAADLDFYQSLPALSQGNVAQQIFWYTAFVPSMVATQAEGNNTVDADGNLLWRMAPSPHGSYWKEGMQSATRTSAPGRCSMTPDDRRKAAWLFAQFAGSKTVDTVKKSHVGLTFARDSSIRHESFTERAPQLGGLIEFYRSPDRVGLDPTGINVPDYPRSWRSCGGSISAT